MEVKEVTVGIQRVINLGNYENVRYECSVTVTKTHDDETPQDLYNQGLDFCKENVGAEVDRLEAYKKAAKAAKSKA